jgi:hypothetical protein
MKSGFSPFYPISYTNADIDLKLILAPHWEWKQFASIAS